MIRIAAILLTAMLLVPEKKVSVVDMAQLQSSANKNNDTLYVVNFWATWCKPCVNELPYFQNAAQKFKGQKVKVIFVSLNSVKEQAAVEKFISDKPLMADVDLLNAGNPNIWIDQVDSSWSGAIPATAMYRKGKKTFFREGEFTQNELDSIILTKNK